MALSLKQAWQAVVTGKITPSDSGAVDTKAIFEAEAVKNQEVQAAQTAAITDEKQRDTPPQTAMHFSKTIAQSMKNPMDLIGISSDNPNPEILPDENTITDEERVFAAISYFPFLSFFVLATRKDSLFVSFHAWQGFSFFVIFVISLPIYWLFSVIPGFSLLSWVFYLLLFGSSFYAAFRAWMGRYVYFPVISPFAQKLGGNGTQHLS